MEREPENRTEGITDSDNDHLRDLRLLFQVGSELAVSADLNDPSASLSNAVRRFCLAFNAELASLYLWHGDISKFVLCASYGWASPEWVNAARFSPNLGWVGGAAMQDRPLYVSDLRAYEKATDCAAGFYSLQMFGSNLPPGLTWEAIGLPLKVGPERLGVLTLHRRKSQTNTGEITGFVTLNPEILKEGANNLAAFITLLLVHQQAVWERKAARRRAELYEALTTLRDNENRKVEDKICQVVAKSFDARSVEMYVTVGDEAELTWCGGSPGADNSNRQHLRPDTLVSDAAASKNVELVRRVIEAECSNADIVATEGLIERACVPLLAAEGFCGVIDLRWEVRPVSGLPISTGFSLMGFRELGRMLASFYWRHRLTTEQEAARAQAERSRFAVQAVGAMVFQYAHRLRNFIQKLHDLSVLIAEAETAEGRTERIAQLRSTMDTTLATLKWPIEIAQRISHQSGTISNANLRELVRQCIDELTVGERSGVEIRLMVSADLTLALDSSLIKEAFINIIENALNAMPNGGLLTIEALHRTQDGKTPIVFTDSGRGMTSEEVSAALTGFAGKPEHRGVGLLISATIIQTQGGTLSIRSTKGSGTSVVVTLPLAHAVNK